MRPVSDILMEMVLSLVDMFQTVPRLWDFMDGNCKKALLGTCMCLRKETGQVVSKVSLRLDWQAADVASLVTRNWAQLQHLDLSGGLIFMAAATHMSTASWPMLRRLELSTLSNCEHKYFSWPQLFQSFEGRWELLQEFACPTACLDKSAMVALTGLDWPMLALLDITLSPEAMPVLVQGKWPHLKHIYLKACYRSKGISIHDMSSCWSGWSSLEVMRLRLCNISHEAANQLVKAHLPSLKRLCLLELSLVDGAQSLRPLCQGSWPHLTELSIHLKNRQSPDDSFVWPLVSGAWPSLQTLTFAFDVSQAAIAVLLQASWPSVASLLLGGDRENHATVIAACVHKWPALKSLTLRCSLSPGGVDVEGDVLVFWEKEKILIMRRWPLLECSLIL